MTVFGLQVHTPKMEPGVYEVVVNGQHRYCCVTSDGMMLEEVFVAREGETDAHAMARAKAAWRSADPKLKLVTSHPPDVSDAPSCPSSPSSSRRAAVRRPPRVLPLPAPPPRPVEA